MDHRALEIGQAFLDWHAPQVSDSLSLVSYEWRETRVNEPVYPANPLALPRAYLKPFTGQVTPIPARGVDYDYAYSLYFQRRQTPGEHHGALLQAALKILIAPLLGNFCPDPIKQAGADYFAPIQTVLHDDLRHPRIDDPRLRVSTAEIVLLAKSHDRR